VFVAGDNPSVSCDSRALGPIPKDAVEARLLFRYWPLDRIGRVE
jgi:signal peptidase I